MTVGGGELIQASAVDRTALSRRVSADLGAAFARAGAPEHPTIAAAPPSAAVSALRPGRSHPRLWMIGVAAAAGLSGIAAGAFVIRPPAPPGPPHVPAVAAAAAAPVPPQSAAAASAPPAMTAAAAEPPLTAPVAAAPAIRTAKPADPVVRPARVRTHVERSDGDEDEAEVPLCPTGEGCRAAVLDADRRLREAYAHAVRAGVPNHVLVEYRERWDDARSSDSDRPARLVETYGSLARDLRRESAESRPRSARRDQRFTLRTIVPWW